MKIAICEDVQSCAETLENFIRNWSADNGVFVEIYTYSSAEQYLFYLDETVVGTVFTNKSVSGEEGQYLDLTIKLPTDNFAPGKYKVVALAFEKDQYGNQVGVDRVSPALGFEILSENDKKYSN